jgi:hypothetical protein
LNRRLLSSPSQPSTLLATLAQTLGSPSHGLSFFPAFFSLICPHVSCCRFLP